MKRMVSTVKWFSNRSGFGFLNPVVEGEDDIAVHHSEVERDFENQYVRLNEGETVSFVLQHHMRGPRAVQVRKENGCGN